MGASDLEQMSRAWREFVVDGRALARGAMWDARWGWHAAGDLGAEAVYAPMARSCPPRRRPQVFTDRGNGA